MTITFVNVDYEKALFMDDLHELAEQVRKKRPKGSLRQIYGTVASLYDFEYDGYREFLELVLQR